MFRCRLGTAHFWGTLGIMDIMDLHICYNSLLECGNTVPCSNKITISSFLADGGKVSWRRDFFFPNLHNHTMSTSCSPTIFLFFGSFYASMQKQYWSLSLKSECDWEPICLISIWWIWKKSCVKGVSLNITFILNCCWWLCVCCHLSQVKDKWFKKLEKFTNIKSTKH